jgi:hypothetical protein
MGSYGGISGDVLQMIAREDLGSAHAAMAGHIFKSDVKYLNFAGRILACKQLCDLKSKSIE